VFKSLLALGNPHISYCHNENWPIPFVIFSIELQKSETLDCQFPKASRTFNWNHWSYNFAQNQQIFVFNLAEEN